jgi:hypothetical protein
MDETMVANLLALAKLLFQIAVYCIQWKRGRSGGASG